MHEPERRTAHARPKKRLGQHFLHDPAVVRKIVGAIAPRSGDAMVEIGGGPGALTRPLVEILDRLHVVEVDAGLETIEIDLPAVITTDLRLNEPRYVKLPDIMKAKKKQLDTLAIADLGVDAGAQFKTLKYAPPASRQKGIMVKDVAGLVDALKQKGLL